MSRWPSHAHQKIAASLADAHLAPRLRGAEIRYDFWSSVDRSAGLDACWPWTGPQNATGYGNARIWFQGGSHTAGAHRVALFLETGLFFWGRGRVVRHLCARPACCNPRHLLMGTPSENAWDTLMHQRGVDLVAIRAEVEASRLLPFEIARVREATWRHMIERHTVAVNRPAGRSVLLPVDGWAA